jgi:hypothetical protein
VQQQRLPHRSPSACPTRQQPTGRRRGVNTPFMPTGQQLVAASASRGAVTRSQRTHTTNTKQTHPRKRTSPGRRQAMSLSR